MHLGKEPSHVGSPQRGLLLERDPLAHRIEQAREGRRVHHRAAFEPVDGVPTHARSGREALLRPLELLPESAEAGTEVAEEALLVHLVGHYRVKVSDLSCIWRVSCAAAARADGARSPTLAATSPSR